MKNDVARIIKIIGVLIVVVGIIGAVGAAGKSKDLSGPVLIAIGGLVSGMMMFGFGEIIDLLAENGKKQQAIIELLQKGKAAGEERQVTATVLQLGAIQKITLHRGNNYSYAIASQEDNSFVSEYDEKIVDVAWGDWQGDSMKFAIRGIAYGATDIIIQGDHSKKTTTLHVNVI